VVQVHAYLYNRFEAVSSRNPPWHLCRVFTWQRRSVQTNSLLQAFSGRSDHIPFETNYSCQMNFTHDSIIAMFELTELTLMVS